MFKVCKEVTIHNTTYLFLLSISYKSWVQLDVFDVDWLDNIINSHRDSGMDSWQERWNVDGFSHSESSGKCYQVKTTPH